MARNFGFEPTTNPPYYFISYNSQDAARVSAICRELNRRGVPMWYDKGLLSGEKWEKQITLQIKNCHEMILFVTKNLMARENPFVYKEYIIAKKYHKKIHIVILDEITFENVSDDLKVWFVDIESLQGVYPPPFSAPVQVADAMDTAIEFVRKYRFHSRSSINKISHSSGISGNVKRYRSTVTTSNKNESMAKGVVGAVIGAFLGMLVYLVLSIISNFHMAGLSIFAGMLSVVFYTMLHGIQSKKTVMGICFSVSAIVSVVFMFFGMVFSYINDSTDLPSAFSYLIDKQLPFLLINIVSSIASDFIGVLIMIKYFHSNNNIQYT